MPLLVNQVVATGTPPPAETVKLPDLPTVNIALPLVAPKVGGWSAVIVKICGVAALALSVIFVVPVVGGVPLKEAVPLAAGDSMKPVWQVVGADGCRREAAGRHHEAA